MTMLKITILHLDYLPTYQIITNIYSIDSLCGYIAQVGSKVLSVQ